MESTRDLIDLYMEYSEGTPSPPLFRLWGAISMIANALGRRVWYISGRGPAYPNLFVILVAPPAVGKYVISDVRGLLGKTTRPDGKERSFHLASHSVTKASMIDEMAKASRMVYRSSGEPEDHHSLSIVAEEFSVLMPMYDNEFINNLNALWNNNDEPYTETRRTSVVKSVTIENAGLNILAGFQPAMMASIWPQEAWSSGFTRRLLMIFCGQRVKTPLWEIREEKAEQRKVVLSRLRDLGEAYGRCEVDRDAKDFIAEWDDSGGPPAPTHSKLQYYNDTRTHTVLKLGLISAMARGVNYRVTLADYQRAISWLTHAETFMPDIFRAMIGKSDFEINEELRLAMIVEFGRQKRPVTHEFVWKFIAMRVPQYKIEGIIQSAINSGYIAQVALSDPPTYVPRYDISPRE